MQHPLIICAVQKPQGHYRQYGFLCPQNPRRDRQKQRYPCRCPAKMVNGTEDAFTHSVLFTSFLPQKPTNVAVSVSLRSRSHKAISSRVVNMAITFFKYTPFYRETGLSHTPFAHTAQPAAKDAGTSKIRWLDDPRNTRAKFFLSASKRPSTSTSSAAKSARRVPVSPGAGRSLRSGGFVPSEANVS